MDIGKGIGTGYIGSRDGVVIPVLVPETRQRITGEQAAGIIQTVKEIGRNLGYHEVRLDRMQHGENKAIWFETRYVHGEVQIVRPEGFAPVKIWWADDPWISRVTVMLGDIIAAQR
jgi:hypothetical protein